MSMPRDFLSPTSTTPRRSSPRPLNGIAYSPRYLQPRLPPPEPVKYELDPSFRSKHRIMTERVVGNVPSKYFDERLFGPFADSPRRRVEREIRRRHLSPAKWRYTTAAPASTFDEMRRDALETRELSKSPRRGVTAVSPVMEYIRTGTLPSSTRASPRRASSPPPPRWSLSRAHQRSFDSMRNETLRQGSFAREECCLREANERRQRATVGLSFVPRVAQLGHTSQNITDFPNLREGGGRLYALDGN